MICRAGEHYSVVRTRDRISRLVCCRCPFIVLRDSVSGANAPGWTGGKSGLARYNRMRAVMVRHIHVEHAPHRHPKRRPCSAVLVARSIEVHCPHCEASQPAPGGSEFCEVREAKEMCDGAVRPCVACDEPIRMTWHDRVQAI